MENTNLDNEFDLLLGVLTYHQSVLVEKIISELKALRDPNFLLSGDDSGLKNIWEEICSQVQGEESYHWDVYISTIEDFIETELKDLDERIYKVLKYLHFNGRTEDESALNQSILDDILFQAELFTNSNIEIFLNDDYEEDEDEDEEEDEDEHK